ncbi:hypothetical protein CF327_g3017 [Tilletia walkeri]|nr:hypothetical protein CF327_g3017 [Tilletia walkeri]
MKTAHFTSILILLGVMAVTAAPSQPPACKRIVRTVKPREVVPPEVAEARRELRDLEPEIRDLILAKVREMDEVQRRGIRRPKPPSYPIEGAGGYGGAPAPFTPPEGVVVPPGRDSGR